jgi:hypothetical protein
VSNVWSVRASVLCLCLLISTDLCMVQESQELISQLCASPEAEAQAIIGEGEGLEEREGVWAVS